MSSGDFSREDITDKAVLLLLAIGLNALEAFIPRIPFLPWLKPGFANIVTIIWVIRYGTVDALVFSLLRIWIVGFYFGFSLLTLSLGVSGAVTSTIVTGVLWSVLGRKGWLGLFGIGVAGAITHNAAQLVMVYLLMARNAYLFYQIPVMLAVSLVLGGSVGLLAVYCYPRWKAGDAMSAGPEPTQVTPLKPASQSNIVASVMLFGLCVAVMFEQSAMRLGIWSVAAVVAVQIVLKWRPAAIWYPLRRFWVLFLFVALMYLFLSYGKSIPGIPFITYDGAHETVCQWMRLWVWLQLSQMLAAFRFNEVFMGLLTFVFPAQRATIYSGILALEHFPAMLDIGKETGIGMLNRIRSGKWKDAGRMFNGMYKRVAELV